MSWVLVAAALLPAIALLVFIYIKDRAEKEPIGLLLKLFFSGILVVFMVLGVSEITTPLIANLGEGTLYNFVHAFFGVALVEEGCKFIVLFLITRNNRNFDSLFDGVIYAVFVSLGFAAFENILYVSMYGFGNAIMRAFTAVPGHMFFAVLMGYYYTMFNVHKKAQLKEREYKNRGFIVPDAKEFSCVKYIILAVVMPVLAHGFYDFCCFEESWIFTIIFFVFLAFLYGYCFKKINKVSKADTSDSSYVNAMLFNKYPRLIDNLLTMGMESETERAENLIEK